jgi:hypothetical protein
MPDSKIQPVEGVKDENGDGILIKRNTIPDYFNADFYRVLSWWDEYRLDNNGWPFAGGWAQQPAHVHAAIRLFQRAVEEYRIEQQSKPPPKRGRR